jgi:hypothetical protein
MCETIGGERGGVVGCVPHRILHTVGDCSTQSGIQYTLVHANWQLAAMFSWTGAVSMTTVIQTREHNHCRDATATGCRLVRACNNRPSPAMCGYNERESVFQHLVIKAGFRKFNSPYSYISPTPPTKIT